MAPNLPSLLLAYASLLSLAAADVTELVGTWSTKSGAVLTGPGFYNPVNDSMIEPTHTGISYSFTADGFYEEAYYRAVSNPTTPKCPQAIMQWQHGTFVENSTGSLILTPFSVDGRQLQSDPCNYKNSIYTRYNQTETIKKYAVSTDGYTKLTRLDLYEWDGTPMNPMFLAYSPAMMLPTQTLNPTAAASSTSKAKRWLGGSSKEEEPLGHVEGIPLPLNKNTQHIKRGIQQQSWIHRVDLDFVWWTGVGMAVFGGAAYLI
jgi:hypothetical protein